MGSLVITMYILAEGKLSPSDEGLVNLESLSLSDRIVYSMVDETISPSDDAFELLRKDFYQALKQDM